VISPILLPVSSVNQIVLSGPVTIAKGSEFVVGTANSVKLPSVVTRPILLPPVSANQSAPSGPTVIP
jgi:hypothetical protein